MNPSNEPHNSGSEEDMQRANARGDNQNEQGQSSFATGTTTGGGSNFGQGSSHLGGESYRQGHETNSGTNSANEAGRLAASSTGTANEGSSSADAGAAASGYDKPSTEPLTPRNDEGGEEARRGNAGKPVFPEEGDRRDTELEQNTGLGESDNRTEGRQSGSWSRSTTED